MTPEEQTEHWYKYNSFRLRKARQYEPAMKKALQAQLQYFADTRNIDLLPIEPVYNAIKTLYTDVGPLWAHQSYLATMSDGGRKAASSTMQTKIRMPIGFNEDFVNSILAYFNTRLLNDAVIPITETTKDFIRQTLSDGVAQGKSIDEMVQEMLSSDLTQIRAQLIARTETMKAANEGEQIGAAKTGLKTLKIWIATRDNRTRFDHMETDGQTVADGNPFNVGGYLMDRPGVSKTADGLKVPAKEVCNCRCVIGRKVLRGSNGLPLTA